MQRYAQKRLQEEKEMRDLVQKVSEGHNNSKAAKVKLQEFKQRIGTSHHHMQDMIPLDLHFHSTLIICILLNICHSQRSLRTNSRPPSPGPRGSAGRAKQKVWDHPWDPCNGIYSVHQTQVSGWHRGEWRKTDISEITARDVVSQSEPLNLQNKSLWCHNNSH